MPGPNDGVPRPEAGLAPRGGGGEPLPSAAVTMEITYLGHACLLVRSGGTSLLMDPWLVDPAYCNSWFHYPPLELGLEDVAPVDFVWCSHDHPDHFDKKTLARLPKSQRCLIADFTSKELERKFRREGFQNLQVLPFGQPVRLGTDLTVTLLRSDLVWEDSAIVVQGGGTTVFNMNDCKLGDELLREVGRRWAPDIVFVPFSGAVHFPTCYGYTRQQRAELTAGRRRKHLDGFVRRCQLLAAKRAVPFAGNFALLHEDQLWMNEKDQNNINTPDEAIGLLNEKAPATLGLQMNPGDRWSLERGLVRAKPAPDFAGKQQQLARMSREWSPRLAALRGAEPEARESLLEDTRRYFERIARNHPELCGRIDARIAIVAEGKNGGALSLHFHGRTLDVAPFRDGDPWSFRMTLPAEVLQQAIDGEICWDEVAISFRVRFAENPEFFNRDFWVMLYNNTKPFLDEYLANPDPKYS